MKVLDIGFNYKTAKTVLFPACPNTGKRTPTLPLTCAVQSTNSERSVPRLKRENQFLPKVII
jgi:hypothetical protein